MFFFSYRTSRGRGAGARLACSVPLAIQAGRRVCFYQSDSWPFFRRIRLRIIRSRYRSDSNPIDSPSDLRNTASHCPRRRRCFSCRRGDFTAADWGPVGLVETALGGAQGAGTLPLPGDTRTLLW